MTILRYALHILTITLLGIAASAQDKQPEPDLFCEPVGIVDGGFRVMAWMDESGKIQTEITRIGWLSRRDFKGPLTLISESVTQKCIYKLVDQVESPQTQIVMQFGSEDVLRMLNGKKLSVTHEGKEVAILNRLSCTPSERFLDKMLSLCNEEAPEQK